MNVFKMQVIENTMEKFKAMGVGHGGAKS